MVVVVMAVVMLMFQLKFAYKVAVTSWLVCNHTVAQVMLKKMGSSSNTSRVPTLVAELFSLRHVKRNRTESVEKERGEKIMKEKATFILLPPFCLEEK